MPLKTQDVEKRPKNKKQKFLFLKFLTYLMPKGSLKKMKDFEKSIASKNGALLNK